MQPFGLGGGAVVTGAPVGGGTANAVLYVDSTGKLTSSANLTFSDTLVLSGPGLRVGTTAASAGLYFGPQANTFGAIWSGEATPSASNWSLMTNGSHTYINAPLAAGKVFFNVANATTRMTVNPAGAAGSGLEITAGTAATNAPRALSISQTWTDGTTSNIGIVGNFDMGETGTATGKLLSLQAGAAGTTEVFSVSQAGIINIPASGGITAAGVLTATTGGSFRIDDQSNLTMLISKADWRVANGTALSWTNSDSYGGTADSSFSRISAGLIGVGTGAVGSFAGSLKATNIEAVGNLVTATQSPASNAAGTAGTVTWDASYIYICTASGVWKRVAITGGY